MPAEQLSYATPAVPEPKPPLTPEQRRRRRRAGYAIGVLLVAFLVLIYVLFIGENKWRVRLHHGVSLPASTTNLRCTGSTAFTFLLGDDSWATFEIAAADLPSLLSQFQFGDWVEPAGGGEPQRVIKPWTGPIPPDGDRWGPSPTGRDWFTLTWKTLPDGTIGVHIHTSWN